MDAKTPGTAITIDTGTNELLCAIRDRVAIITLMAGSVSPSKGRRPVSSS